MKRLSDDHPIRPPKDLLLHNKTEKFETDEQRIWWDALVRLSDFVSLAMQDAVERTTGKYRPMLFTEFLERIYYVAVSNRACGQGLAFDEFVQIARFSIPALKHIVSSPSKQIIKNQEKVHVSKIRQTGSKTMQWMSKRPGRSVQEKIAPENKVMTNVTHFSTDTKENRETVYLYNILHDIIRERLKENNCLACVHSKECDIPIDALRDTMALHNKIRTGELADVQAAKQTLQNNKLMCDKYYKMIWDAVQRLSRIEDKIDNDWLHLHERYMQLGFWIVASIILHETESQIVDFYGVLTDKEGLLSFTILGDKDQRGERIADNDICFYPTFHSWEPIAIYLRDNLICLFDVGKNEEIGQFDLFDNIEQLISCEYESTALESGKEEGTPENEEAETERKKEDSLTYRLNESTEESAFSGIQGDKDNAEDHPEQEQNDGKLTLDSSAPIDDVPIEDMGLSVRSFNSLRRAGYKVSGQFIHLPDKELLKTRNLGQKGVDEIRRWSEDQTKESYTELITEPEQIDERSNDIHPITRTEKIYNINAELEHLGEAADLSQIQPGDSVIFGTYYWISEQEKREIEWIVLGKKHNSIMVLSKYALAAMPYTTDKKPFANWPKSSIRAWLNEQFINDAFTNQQLLHISETEVTNLQSESIPETEVGDCKPTRDKVFLLSYREAMQYFATDDDRATVATPYAESILYSNKSSNKPYWILRSNGTNMAVISAVNESGAIVGSGTKSTKLIRPAIWIDLECDELDL